MPLIGKTEMCSIGWWRTPDESVNRWLLLTGFHHRHLRSCWITPAQMTPLKCPAATSALSLVFLPAVEQKLGLMNLKQQQQWRMTPELGPRKFGTSPGPKKRTNSDKPGVIRFVALLIQAEMLTVFMMNSVPVQWCGLWAFPAFFTWRWCYSCSTINFTYTI